ncbi:hypothetical protein COY95_04660, partial [Candidatus Woesearchaeota archaeon CG_4_10_14_0_8_um_filter_47_5]
MTKELSSVDLFYLTREFQQLISGKIDKIYQCEHDGAGEFLFIFHIPSLGKKILRIMLPGMLYLTDYKPETPLTPSGFCMFLRKYLTNARLRSLSQFQPERILEFVFEKKEGSYHLIVELFSPGNILLLKEDNTIMSALLCKKWKDRDILPKKPYTFPQSPYNLFTIDAQALLGFLSSTDKNVLVTALAVDLGFGGKYAEEISLRAQLDKNMAPSSCTDAQAHALIAARDSIIRQVRQAGEAAGGYIIHDIHVRDIRDNGGAVKEGAIREVAIKDVVPLRLLLYEKYACEEAAS